MWSGGAFFESQNAKIVVLSAARLVGMRLDGGLLVSCKCGCRVRMSGAKRGEIARRENGGT